MEYLKLDEIDKKLLKAIYDKDFNNKPIDWTAFNFESNNHKAFHLKRLERFGLVEFEGYVFDTGGKTDPKYGLAIVFVHQEGIHIKEKGIELIDN